MNSKVPNLSKQLKSQILFHKNVSPRDLFRLNDSGRQSFSLALQTPTRKSFKDDETT